MQEATREIAWKAGIIVREENHAHAIDPGRARCVQLARLISRCSSRNPATISPTNPKPKSAMPLITIVSTRLSRGRKPMP